MASVNSPMVQQATFGTLLAIFTEIKLQNDLNYYELCYRNGKMTKDESMKAITEAKNVAKSYEDTIFGDMYNTLTGEFKEKGEKNG